MIYKFKFILFIAFSTVCLLFINSAANAQLNNIAIIDMDKILSNSMAGRSIQNQLKEKREAFQQEFTSRENTLVASEKKLIQEKGSLTPEAFEAKRKEFENQLLETRNLFQKRRNALDKGLNTSLSILREEVMKVTAEISEEQNYSMILTRDSVVIMDKKFDVTDLVLAKMNQSMQTIPLTVSQ